MRSTPSNFWPDQKVKVLALLDERERNQQYIESRDQENEDIALTVGKLRVELEGKDSKKSPILQPTRCSS